MNGLVEGVACEVRHDPDESISDEQWVAGEGNHPFPTCPLPIADAGPQ